mgnify:CR=1 FL=1
MRLLSGTALVLIPSSRNRPFGSKLALIARCNQGAVLIPSSRNRPFGKVENPFKILDSGISLNPLIEEPSVRNHERRQDPQRDPSVLIPSSRNRPFGTELSSFGEELEAGLNPLIEEPSVRNITIEEKGDVFHVLIPSSRNRPFGTRARTARALVLFWS